MGSYVPINFGKKQLVLKETNFNNTTKTNKLFGHDKKKAFKSGFH